MGQMPNEHLFFSIIIPAHNEAAYIGDTLSHIATLTYPKDRYETIVVENGSTDGTDDVIKKIDGITALQSEQGVSKAKNIGMRTARADSDWLIFLDADTLLEPEFLNELNTFLRERSAQNFSVGTVAVQPHPSRLYARLWFRFYDIGHKLTKRSYAIQIARRDLFPPLRFDESLVTSEDGDLTDQALAHGRFFFMPTRAVSTSTRRFDTHGWWRTFFYWTLVDRLPKSLRKKMTYGVVR